MKLEEVLAIEKKVCTSCRHELPRKKFGIRKDKRRGDPYSLNSQCNPCRAEKKKKRYWEERGVWMRPSSRIRRKLWEEFQKTAEVNGVTTGQALEIACRSYIERTYRRKTNERAIARMRGWR